MTNLRTAVTLTGMNPLNAHGHPLRYFTVDDRMMTTQMFLEHYDPSDTNVEWPAQYTLLSYDTINPVNQKPIPSLHKLYVDMQDLSEHRFANEHFFNYTHWELIKALPFFGKFYEVMRAELEAKLSSMAQHQMVTMTQTGTATQSTLKFLANKEYNGKVKEETTGNPHSKGADLHVIHGDDLDRITG